MRLALFIIGLGLYGQSAQQQVLFSAQKPAAGGGCSQATAFLARTSGLDATHQTRYTTLICGLVTDGTFSKLSVLYVFATADTTTAALNLISSSFNGTTHGTLTFVANTGWTGDASTGYIDTGCNPIASCGPTQNSSSLGAYVRTSRTTPQTYAEIGQSVNFFSFLFPNYNTGTATYGINSPSLASPASANAQGFWIASRTSSTQLDLYKNGTSFDSQAANSSGTADNDNIYVFAQNSGSAASFTADQLAAALAGTALTGTDMANISSRINTYMTAYGVNVY